MSTSPIERIVTRRLVHQLVSQRLVERVYNQPLIGNVERGQYVECMIELALSEIRPPWTLTETWAGWDLEQRETRARIEVKQSAKVQTWTAMTPGSTSPSFVISPHTGYYMDGGASWVETGLMRHADVYIMALHSEANPDIADHRLPEQWQFYVVPADRFVEGQKTISLNPLLKLAEPCTYDQLASKVADAFEGLSLKADLPI